eukprot:371563_1
MQVISEVSCSLSNVHVSLKQIKHEQCVIEKEITTITNKSIDMNSKLSYNKYKVNYQENCTYIDNKNKQHVANAKLPELKRCNVVRLSKVVQKITADNINSNINYVPYHNITQQYVRYSYIRYSKKIVFDRF